MKKISIQNVVYFLGLFLVLTGFTSSKTKNSFPESPPLKEGQLIFEEMGCVMCHGYQGMGDGFLADGLNPKPRNFTSYKEMNRIPYQSMYAAIKEGIPSSGMPAFNLSDKQIDDVIAYVKTFLTENYMTVNTCVDTPQVISLDNVEVGGHFEIESDKENFVTTSVKAGELTLTPNFINLLKTFKKENTGLVRVHVSLTKGEEDNKQYLAIIALRIKDCFKN
ncbi:MAG: hypothetical protein COV66_00010 [Nitrospinae bacterium CG11_big_fil_rev_8_21_14_0_20_45_15]|nr:MAG: hypothetical protein COV66_00010 [Nitrospinae bacterium CG11_big_fil_rev_8_21_14_0_20_45_15]